MKCLRLSITVVTLLLPTLAAAQSSTASAGWLMPRTEFGHPDLQGVWGNSTQTPIERPPELGEKKSYTEAEALALESTATDSDRQRNQPLAADRAAPEVGSRIGQEADFDYSDPRINVLRVKGEYRTSMIVEPADGRFPFLDGARDKDIHGQWRAQGFGNADGPEIRPVGERCLSRGIPPMVVPPYNTNFQIVQTRDHVMLLGEMVHDARIVKLDGAHRSGNAKSWLGDSVGRWEGDTLVVHTVNFRAEISHFRVLSTDQMELTERFELVGDGEIFYSFTVTDPALYSRPFTEELTLKRLAAGEQVYEYACHEGNHSMPGILGGARRQELDAKTPANN